MSATKFPHPPHLPLSLRRACRWRRCWQAPPSRSPLVPPPRSRRRRSLSSGPPRGRPSGRRSRIVDPADCRHSTGDGRRWQEASSAGAATAAGRRRPIGPRCPRSRRWLDRRPTGRTGCHDPPDVRLRRPDRPPRLFPAVAAAGRGNHACRRSASPSPGRWGSATASRWKEIGSALTTFGYLGIIVAMLWSATALAVRRGHDIGWPAWLTLVPVLGLPALGLALPAGEPTADASGAARAPVGVLLSLAPTLMLTVLPGSRQRQCLRPADPRAGRGRDARPAPLRRLTAPTLRPRAAAARRARVSGVAVRRRRSNRGPQILQHGRDQLGHRRVDVHARRTVE